MLTYTVEHNPCLTPFVQKTLYIEGKADCKQWEKLKVIFFDALSSSDHLIVDLSNVEEFDFSLTALICSIQKTANLLGKRLTIEGEANGLFECANECALQSHNKECIIMLNTPCYLWESRARAIPDIPGAWKKRQSRRKHARKM